MFERSLPEWVRRAPAPGARGFALLAGIEASVRAMLVSVWPLEMYRAFGDAGTVSLIYLAVGIVSLCAGLLVPALTRHLPRRWTYTLGVLLYGVANAIALLGGPFVAVAVGVAMLATVTVFVCFNAYVLDYIARADLGRTETLRMFYSALAWTVGPLLGVILLDLWRPAPFVISTGFALVHLAVFWVMRLGNGKAIARARRPAPNPMAYLGRFFAQPRLISGWTFAVMRSTGWYVFVVFLPIWAVKAGLGDKIGGLSMSLASALMFTTPLMLRWMQARSVRRAVRAGFLGAAVTFALATLLADAPWLALASLMAGALFLLLLDICGGLPFLMAVKPSERTEMAAVYSSYRDVSGIVSPALAWVVLLAAPLSGVFAAAGLLFGGCWVLAGRLHPRLGVARITARGAVVVKE